MSGKTRPQGGHGSHEDIKKKLEETIKAAQKTLEELSVKDGGKQKKPAPKKKQNTRGSKSMMDLSSANKIYGKSQEPSGNRAREYRNSPLLPNPPPLMAINPQFMNPMWNAAPSPYLMTNEQYGPYYGNIPPRVFNDNNTPPPSYTSVPSHSNIAPQPHSSFGHGPPPPPSYDDTVKNDQQVKQKVLKPKLSADNLVKTLALFNGQFGTAEMLARQTQVTPEDVIICAKIRKDLFALMGEGKDSVIELVPKVSLCTSYISDVGCDNRQSCMKLHICKSYVTDTCKSQSCQYGHRWDTTHNSTVLSKLYLDLINPNTLYHIIRKICRVSWKLQVCNNYNSARGCKNGDDCRFMHICKSYVSGQGKCSVKGCSFNHNLASQQCSKLIKSSGVPANENRQEILARLLSSLEKNESSCTVNKSKNEDKKVNENIAGNKKNGKQRAKCDSSSDGSRDSESSDDTQDKGNRQAKKKQRDRKTKTKVVTVQSSDVSGDVDIAEICLYAIDNSCRNTKNGCRYLHAKSLFQWQAEKDGKWYNLRVFQSKALENAYRDVSKGTVRVPPLDESKLEDKAKELLNILGTAAWKADFQSMTMTCKGEQLKIRRVSTQSSVLSSSPKATVYEWYFEDEKEKWIPYGEVDSLGNQFLICSVSSDDIEKQYLSNPSSSLLISSAHYKYKLDFSKMTQMNLDTKKEREIRRRPSRLSYQKKKASEHDPYAAIPPHWNQMADNQTHLLVPLDAKSQEYQETASRLRLTLPTANIQKIQRLQNPYLWRLFQYKKAQLSQRYDELQLNVQKLFHGTNVQSIDTICKENFDWRQGIAVQQSYGQGTYFSNSAATARGHCTQDNFGRITMFLAQVIIGMVAKGDPSLTRPPCNPSTNALYDTTVDDITAPTVFVKYDKEEYYPEYIIEFY